MSSDLPGDWQEETYEADDIDTEGLVHRMKHTLDDLQPATDYHAAIEVKNKFTWSASTEYAFSTKKGMCVFCFIIYNFFSQHTRKRFVIKEKQRMYRKHQKFCYVSCK